MTAPDPADVMAVRVALTLSTDRRSGEAFERIMRAYDHLARSVRSAEVTQRVEVPR